MSLVDAARRLADVMPSCCCWQGDADGHKADCPTLALPQIVKALEAAQALSESLDQTADGPPNYALVQALRRALRMQAR